MTILAAVNDARVPDPVVGVAYDLAATYGEELVTLHVIPEGEARDHITTLREIPEFADVGTDQPEQSAAQIADRVVRETLGGDHDPEVVRAVGRVGPRRREILIVAEDVDARYLVMGGRKHSPAGKAIFGNLTQGILLNADCPVVTLMFDRE